MSFFGALAGFETGDVRNRGLLWTWGRNEEWRWSQAAGFNLAWCGLKGTWLLAVHTLVVRGARLVSFDGLRCCKYRETWADEEYIQAGYQKRVWDSQTTEIWEWPWGKRSSSFEVDARSACEMGLYALVAGESDGKGLVIKGGSSCPQMGFRMS